MNRHRLLQAQLGKSMQVLRGTRRKAEACWLIRAYHTGLVARCIYNTHTRATSSTHAYTEHNTGRETLAQRVFYAKPDYAHLHTSSLFLVSSRCVVFGCKALQAPNLVVARTRPGMV